MFVNIVQDDVAGCFEYYADLAEGLDAKQKAPVSVPMETFKSYVLKEPIGVVGLITPWYLLPLTALNFLVLSWQLLNFVWSITISVIIIFKIIVNSRLSWNFCFQTWLFNSSSKKWSLI